MNRRILLGTILMVLVWTGRAQEPVAVCDTNDCRAFLTLGGGPSYGVSRDQGVSPIAYQLFALTPYASLTLDYGRWGFTTEMSMSAYLLTKNYHLLKELSIHGYGADLMLLSGFEQREFQSENLRIKLGFAGTGWLLMAYNGSFMNACVSMSALVAPMFYCKGEWDMGRMTLYASAGAAPVGWWYRPGFAYISNYSSGESEVATFNDDYHWRGTIIPLLKTELGIDYHFKSGHSLGATYTWFYLSSNRSGYWTYEAARHHLRLVLRIAL